MHEKHRSRPVKVLQFGSGNFLRGFCDWMIDILNEKTSFNGNVQIVQPLRRGKGIPLAEQNGVYNVTIGNTIRQINCIDSIVDPFNDYNEFLTIAENPDLKFVVSNSTEAGIVFGNDETFPARATALLYRRYQKLPDKGLTFLPCELIEKNGDTLKSVVLQYADHWKLPLEFKQWIDDKIIFLNTLVDRIVTGTGDQLGVLTEPFHLWVIEGSVSIPFTEAGLNVMSVKDLAPYRNRKVRILNGAHTTLVPVAYLKGFRTVRESVEDPEVGSFLSQAIYEEIIPTLDLPKEELVQFADDVLERFKNPFIRHELSSIALNSISKYKVRVLPSVLRYIELKNELPKRLLYSLSELIRLYKTTINDTPEVTEFFKKAWASDKPVSLVLGNKNFWGQDLNEIPGLAEFVMQSMLDHKS